MGYAPFAGCVMARLRTQVPDRDAAEVHAEALRVHAGKMARWSEDRAAWLRCVADGIDAGAIDPTDEVARPGSPPPAAWVRARQQSAAWLAKHGLPADPPEAF